MTSQRARDRLIDRLRQHGIGDERVLAVMAQVPRHLFVDEALSSRAYEDTALPIGHGQTISQPYVVARMTAAAIGVSGTPDKVLEIGTGCGYQTAVLAELAERVYSLERIGALLDGARSRVRRLGCSNVVFREGDGYAGWQDEAPFDAILVAAAPLDVPVALKEQLAIGGRLVIPAGHREGQSLLLIRRQAHGFTEETLDRVRFVPLV
ncbi:MAG: protein-L-isoaspartate(D-aspartate) O-methyltransferase [Gammaproteobacteria bacterium]|nr:protein-L-isoaspartate(D-aspartate) O-methyltransferase [Gammaproteobacteria bacterium]